MIDLTVSVFVLNSRIIDNGEGTYCMKINIIVHSFVKIEPW